LIFFAGGCFSTSFSTFMLSHRLVCPPVLNPLAPSIHPPLSVRPSQPNSRLPAPTVSETRFPPPDPETNCWRNLRNRESRQDVLPPRRFSARWWPVAEELNGSKIWREGLAALPLGAGLCGSGDVMMVWISLLNGEVAWVNNPSWWRQLACFTRRAVT
jgi:hypothetical protein